MRLLLAEFVDDRPVVDTRDGQAEAPDHGRLPGAGETWTRDVTRANQLHTFSSAAP